MLDFDSQCRKVLTELYKLLKEKNTAYGNTAFFPLHIFEKKGCESIIEARIDDKLGRIKKSKMVSKNDTVDLMGYLVLYCIKSGWDNFDDIRS